jgi:hypothetical protein
MKLISAEIAQAQIVNCKCSKLLIFHPVLNYDSLTLRQAASCNLITLCACLGACLCKGVPSKVAQEVKNLSTLTSLSIFWLAARCRRRQWRRRRHWMLWSARRRWQLHDYPVPLRSGNLNVPSSALGAFFTASEGGE